MLKRCVVISFIVFCFASISFSQLTVSKLGFDQQNHFTNTYSQKSFLGRARNYSQGFVWVLDIGFSGRSFSCSFLSSEYQLSNGLTFGAGLKIYLSTLRLPLDNVNDTLTLVSLPFYISAKFHLFNINDGKIQPYLKTSVGYNIIKADNNLGGLILDNGLGVQFGFNENIFLLRTGISQLNQLVIGDYTKDTGAKIKYKIWYNDILFEIGFGINFSRFVSIYGY